MRKISLKIQYYSNRLVKKYNNVHPVQGPRATRSRVLQSKRHGLVANNILEENSRYFR